MKVTILSLLLFVAACHNPAADTSKAVTSEPAKPASPTSAAGEKYVITPQNSKIEFTASKVTGHHNGSFEKFNGEIQHVDNDPTKGRVTITIDMSSVKTDTPKLTEHLKTPDFFDVAKFPQAQFVSTEIKPAVKGVRAIPSRQPHDARNNQGGLVSGNDRRYARHGDSR
jgi:polyisoprenoid-binding protein YceI